jgi:hypothetical protein
MFASVQWGATISLPTNTNQQGLLCGLEALVSG